MILDIPAAPDMTALALAALAKGGPFAALIVMCVPLIEWLKSWTQRRLPAAEPPAPAPAVTVAFDRATVQAAVEAAHAPALEALAARVASIEERHAAEDHAAELAAAKEAGAAEALARARATGDFAIVEPTDGGNSVGRRRPK